MKVSARLCLLALLAALATTSLAYSGSRWATGQARATADATAQSLARDHLGLLASELQKFRLLPLVLADYPDVADALGSGDAAAQTRLDSTLELLKIRTDAAAIYAINRDGRTVAASNWRLPTSFVGQNYRFRPYFTDAIQRGASELFALGTVSGRPGLYLARRVERDGQALGVVVVKVEFDAVEANWARSTGVSIVTDSHGVILVTSVPGWRFLATRPLAWATLADARRTLQFGAGPPQRAPVTIRGRDAIVTAGRTPILYRIGEVAAPLGRARLLHFAPIEPPLAAARTRALLWALGAVLVVGALGGFMVRSAEKRRLDAQARERLEHEVVRRTAELRDANAQLIVESGERIEADRRYRSAREELAQANRLGSLGQITAGVAHEINQPVAAIRTFAENGATLLDRGAPDRTRENLAHIVGLTDRIGVITGELRAFARRKTPTTGSTMLGSVIDGVLLLLGERARGTLAIDMTDAIRATAVVGYRVRLEQILVNLLQNAFDAVDATPAPRVRLLATMGSDRTLNVRVCDNGPGVDASVRDALFTPFTSAKADGLGLGLAIARDIARDFGGELVLDDAAPHGATFLLTLRTA